MITGFQKRTALIFLLSGILLAQSPEKKSTAQQASNQCGIAMEVACGHTSGSVYHNDYFGLSYTFPDSWKPIPQNIILDVHHKKVEKQRADAVRDSHGKPVYLFESWDLLVVSKLGLPAPRDPKAFNSNLLLWADELSPKVHTLADLFEVSGFASAPDAKLLKPLTPVTLAGRQFLRADRLDHTDEGNIYHTRLITFMRNYAIGLDFYSDDQAELEKLLSTSESLKFDVQPDTGSTTAGSYHNPYFGFTYQIPAGMTALDDYETRLIELQNKQQHLADLPSGPQITVSFLTSYNLLNADAKSTPKEKGLRPWMRIWAEKDPFNTTPEDYIYNSSFLTDPDIKGKKLPAKLALGGRTFARATRWGKVQGTAVYESRSIMVYKDLALVFEFGAGSQKELDELLSSMDSIKFD